MRNTAITASKPRTPGADFADYCCELLGSLGPAVAKRMFGGYGLSVDGLTMAIIAWDRLYLKTNADTEPQWLAAGCEKFVFEAKDGKIMQMGYYSAPEAALESRIAMQPWAQLAWQAALAARTKPAKKSTAAQQAAAPSARKAPGKPRAKRASAKTLRSSK